MIPSRLVALVAYAFLAASVARAEPQAPATPGDAVERAFGQLPDGVAAATDPDCWRSSPEPDAPLAPDCLGRGRSLGEALLETREAPPNGPSSAHGPVESSFLSLSRPPDDRGVTGHDLMTPLGRFPDAGAARFDRLLTLPPLEIARPASPALLIVALGSGDQAEDVGPDEAPVVAGADALPLADGPDAGPEVMAIKAEVEPAARAEELQTAAGADVSASPAVDVAAFDVAAPTAPAGEAPAPVVAVEEPERPEVTAVPKPSRRKASAARRAGRARPPGAAPPRQSATGQAAAQTAPGRVDVWRSLRVPIVRRAPLPAPRAGQTRPAPARAVRQPTLTEFTQRLARPVPPQPAASPRRSARP